MVGRFVWGAMYLARAIEYAVQAGWSLIVSLVWFLPLARLGAAESSVDRCVFGTFVVDSTLVLVASWFAIAIPGFRGAGVAGAIASAG